MNFLASAIIRHFVFLCRIAPLPILVTSIAWCTVVDFASTTPARRYHVVNATQTLNDRPILVGDIAFTREQIDKIDRLRRMRRRKRKFVTVKSRVWDLPIRYTIAENTYSEWEKREIREAVGIWENKTCVKFEEMTSHQLYQSDNGIVIKKDGGCWAFIGHRKQYQTISLETDCILELGTILHEIGHTLGFWHEQSRPDRDDYVTIHTDQVDTEKHVINFYKEMWGDITSLSIPYDLGSVMHYGPYQYNKSDKPTLTTNDLKMMSVIGQRENLSFHDIKTANVAYCQNICDNPNLTCLNDGYPDPLTKCTTCRCEPAFTGANCSLPVSPVDNCGGWLSARSSPHTLQSPGYPHEYEADQNCSWIIESPNGTNIMLGITKWPFSLQPGFQRCYDYVEVRYRHNLALRGPRYCYKTSPPGPIIRSHSNRLLVYFNSRFGGLVGFQATFYSESCGGCANQNSQNQPACASFTQTDCLRRWKVRVRVPCMGWWVWTQRFCGYRYETRTRPDKCETKRLYCCKDFRLAGERCKYDPSKPTPDPTKARWGRWTRWTTCSSLCGACGSQSRQRVCFYGNCPRPNKEIERRPCNVQACLIDLTYQCVKNVSYKVKCTPTQAKVVKYCTRYKKKSTICRSKCCSGFTQTGSTCVKT